MEGGRDPVDGQWERVNRLWMRERACLSKDCGRPGEDGEMKEFLNCDLGDRIVITGTGGGTCS